MNFKELYKLLTEYELYLLDRNESVEEVVYFKEQIAEKAYTVEHARLYSLLTLYDSSCGVSNNLLSNWKSIIEVNV